jgi:hypothetical protein
LFPGIDHHSIEGRLVKRTKTIYSGFLRRK